MIWKTQAIARPAAMRKHADHYCVGMANSYDKTQAIVALGWPGHSCAILKNTQWPTVMTCARWYEKRRWLTNSYDKTQATRKLSKTLANLMPGAASWDFHVTAPNYRTSANFFCAVAIRTSYSTWKLSKTLANVMLILNSGAREDTQPTSSKMSSAVWHLKNFL